MNDYTDIVNRGFGFDSYLPKRRPEQLLSDLQTSGFDGCSMIPNVDRKRIWVVPYSMTIPQVEYLLEYVQKKSLSAEDISTEKLRAVSSFSDDALATVLGAGDFAPTSNLPLEILLDPTCYDKE